MKEYFANEKELHFELFRHLKNWTEGIYDEGYSNIAVKVEVSKEPSLPTGRRYVRGW